MREHVMRKRTFWLAVMALFCPSGHGSAAPAIDTGVESRCDLNGYISDTDRNGTNVRSAPRMDAPVIGRLPPPNDVSGNGDDVGASVEVLGSKNGWLLIRYPADADDPTYSPQAFKGQGWVSGGLVSFTIGNTKLRAAPSPKARVIAELSNPDAGWGPDSFAVRRVHSCRGHYAEVTLALPKGMNPPRGYENPIRGWVGAVCANQLTTCDRQE